MLRNAQVVFVLNHRLPGDVLEATVVASGLCKRSSQRLDMWPVTPWPSRRRSGSDPCHNMTIMPSRCVATRHGIASEIYHSGARTAIRARWPPNFHQKVRSAMSHRGTTLHAMCHIITVYVSCTCRWSLLRNAIRVRLCYSCGVALCVQWPTPVCFRSGWKHTTSIPGTCACVACAPFRRHVRSCARNCIASEKRPSTSGDPGMQSPSNNIKAKGHQPMSHDAHARADARGPDPQVQGKDDLLSLRLCEWSAAQAS